jgi:squalene-hopene/tetraprenyl-beta-curcumene cyclase
VQTAIDRAHTAMRALQGRDGRWEGLNLAGAFGTATDLVFERYLGALEPRDAQEGEKYLRSKQLADGSVAGWEFTDEGSLDGTATWYAGMLCAGVSDADPAMTRARLAMESRGGMHNANPLSKLTLVMAGAMEASELPAIPLELELIPGFDDMLAKFFGVNTLMPLHTMGPLIWAVRRGSRPPSPWTEPAAYFAAQKAINYLTDRQDDSGSWIGVTFVTLMGAAALAGLGVSRDDGRIRRALQHIASVKSYNRDGQSGLYVAPFESTLWDTAQWARALVHSGMPADDPALTRAVDFLIEYQTTKPSPWDWQTPPPWAPATGGWPFEVGNERNPDMDSTQEVLSALIAVRNGLRDPPEHLTRAIQRGMDWLLAMQNPDGGWAAFAYGKATPLPGLMYYSSPGSQTDVGTVHKLVRGLSSGFQQMAQLGDPSTADVAGRTLYTLGMHGMSAEDARVRRALAFIEYLREPVTGGFWGMWAINFLPAAAYILTGVARVGADLSEPWVKDALRFILEHQNADGGWGEDPKSYADPSLAGRGETMRSLTGCCTWALITAGDMRDGRTSAAVERGVRYIVEHQEGDGLWKDEHNQGVLMPNVGYYYTTPFSTYMVLEALGAYRQHLEAIAGES